MNRQREELGRLWLNMSKPSYIQNTDFPFVFCLDLRFVDLVGAKYDRTPK